MSAFVIHHAGHKMLRCSPAPCCQKHSNRSCFFQVSFSFLWQELLLSALICCSCDMQNNVHYQQFRSSCRVTFNGLIHSIFHVWISEHFHFLVYSHNGYCHLQQLEYSTCVCMLCFFLFFEMSLLTAVVERVVSQQ